MVYCDIDSENQKVLLPISFALPQTLLYSLTICSVTNLILRIPISATVSSVTSHKFLFIITVVTTQVAHEIKPLYFTVPYYNISYYSTKIC